MSVHHGKSGVVKIATNAVAAVTKFSVNDSVDTSDTTSMGDTAQTHLAGIPGWTAKIDANYDPADTDGQVAITIGASVTVGLYTDGATTGKKYLTGTATVVGISREASVNGIVTFSADLKGNGALSGATAT